MLRKENKSLETEVLDGRQVNQQIKDEMSSIQLQMVKKNGIIFEFQENVAVEESENLAKERVIGGLRNELGEIERSFKMEN